MTPHPETETRDGVVGVCPSTSTFYDGDTIRCRKPDDGHAVHEAANDTWWKHADLARERARQAERTPTPEETTVSETDDSAEWIGTSEDADRDGAPVDEWKPTAPTPEPRTVTVDADDLENVIVAAEWWLSRLTRTTTEDYPWLPRLRAALNRTDTGPTS